MKESVTKVIDTLTQEDFHGAFQKLLERYNKCLAAGGDYFEGDKSFMSVLSIKVPIRKKAGNLFNDPRTFTVDLLIVVVFVQKAILFLDELIIEECCNNLAQIITDNIPHVLNSDSSLS